MFFNREFFEDVEPKNQSKEGLEMQLQIPLEKYIPRHWGKDFSKQEFNFTPNN